MNASTKTATNAMMKWNTASVSARPMPKEKNPKPTNAYLRNCITAASAASGST